MSPRDDASSTELDLGAIPLLDPRRRSIRHREVRGVNNWGPGHIKEGCADTSETAVVKAVSRYNTLRSVSAKALERFCWFGVATVILTLGVAGTRGATTAAGASNDSCSARDRPLRLAPPTSRQMPSLAAARQLVAFDPLVPAGRPFRIHVSRESRSPQRSLSLTYRAADGRRYALSQGRAWDTREQYDSFIRDMARRDPCGVDASAHRLNDGSLALLIEASNRRVLNFRVGNVNLLLLGSPSSLSRAKAFSLANRLRASPARRFLLVSIASLGTVTWRCDPSGEPRYGLGFRVFRSAANTDVRLQIGRRTVQRRQVLPGRAVSFPLHPTLTRQRLDITQSTGARTLRALVDVDFGSPSNSSKCWSYSPPATTVSLTTRR